MFSFSCAEDFGKTFRAYVYLRENNFPMNITIKQPKQSAANSDRKIHSGKVVVTEATDNVWKYENDWAYDLCDVCEDVQECTFAFFCFPLFLADLFDRTDDYWFTSCLVPMSLTSLRSKLRTGFRIKGSICTDCITTSLCPCCSALQMKHELVKHGL